VDDFKNHLQSFIDILNAEAERLEKDNLIPSGVNEPWRYSDKPMDCELPHQPLRAYLNAGKFTVEAESCVQHNNLTGAWTALAKAQNSFLYPMSASGKKAMRKERAKKAGRAGKLDYFRKRAEAIAIDLIISGRYKAGKKAGNLASDVVKKMAIEHLHPDVRSVRIWIKNLTTVKKI